MGEPRPRLARHSDPTLLALEQLRATLNNGATEQERDRWWPVVLKIQSWIDGDPRASEADHDAIRRVREGVSEVYEALNRGHEPATRPRPIFGDRDRSIQDDVNAVSLERRNGYSWFSGTGVGVSSAYVKWSRHYGS